MRFVTFWVIYTKA